jgi:hypothetical protein
LPAAWEEAATGMCWGKGTSLCPVECCAAREEHAELALTIPGYLGRRAPLLTSQPHAPRCVMRSSISRAFTTQERVGPLSSSAMKPTPQASLSLAGSYRPRASGTVLCAMAMTSSLLPLPGALGRQPLWKRRWLQQGPSAAAACASGRRTRINLIQACRSQSYSTVISMPQEFQQQQALAWPAHRRALSSAGADQTDLGAPQAHVRPECLLPR